MKKVSKKWDNINVIFVYKFFYIFLSS
jgi:hypothetical protein